jgi:hypothetical protein
VLKYREKEAPLRRGILIALVALLLLGGTVTATASSDASGNAQHIQWVDKSNVVHIFIFGDEGRPGEGTAVVKGNSPIRFGFEWSEASVALLQEAILDNPLHDIEMSIDGGAFVSVKSGYQSPFVAVPGSGPRWSWDHDGDGLGDGNGNGIGDWDSPVLFWRHVVPEMPYGLHTFDFRITEDGGANYLLSDTITAEFG